MLFTDDVLHDLSGRFVHLKSPSVAAPAAQRDPEVITRVAEILGVHLPADLPGGDAAPRPRGRNDFTLGTHGGARPHRRPSHRTLRCWRL